MNIVFENLRRDLYLIDCFAFLVISNLACLGILRSILIYFLPLVEPIEGLYGDVLISQWDVLNIAYGFGTEMSLLGELIFVPCQFNRANINLVCIFHTDHHPIVITGSLH